MIAQTELVEKDSYSREIEEIATRLKTDPQNGLSMSDAKCRLHQSGKNEITKVAKISPWQILFAQFKNVLILILIFAVFLSIMLGHSAEVIAISVILLFAVILGFIQEYRAERAMEALRQMTAPNATVIREAYEMEIAASDIVPGDVILVGAGDKIPADARLVEAINLQVEESALTGESVPSEKNAGTLLSGNVLTGDQANMIFAGTTATYGRGRAIVVRTGMDTFFGKIAEMLQSVQTVKTPLQQNLDRVGNMIARVAILLVLLIVAIGFLRGQPLFEMILFGIALAVAVVPEALPAVVTISLAMGVQRMIRRNALVRHLPAVETLGSTTVICSDKTGTLTKDEMTVRRIVVGEEVYQVSGSGYLPEGTISRNGSEVSPPKELKMLLTGAVLASDAHLRFNNNRWEIKGDPTEGALVVAAMKAGLSKPDLEKEQPRIEEIPFSSERRRMTTLHHDSLHNRVTAYSKGAPEVVLDSCDGRLTHSGWTPLRAIQKQQIVENAHEMMREGLRVLGVAYKENTSACDAEYGMTFLGLFGMFDPPRPEARDAVKSAKRAGIKVVMITGDHPVTAEAVGREIEVLTNGRILTGSELDSLENEQFEKEVDGIEVFARVSPAHKLRIVSALQKSGNIVAMTGDGVNDAPALKKADIGIAMGITGTDVTKEASAMTLTDDNFASIVAAVEEGRGIFENIKKYLMYLLSSNLGEITLIAAATLLGMPLPLSVVQILYVNLATDGPPAVALSVDPPEDDLMSRPPRDPHQGIFSRSVILLIIAGGVWSAVVNLGLFAWALQSGRSLKQAMTMIFVSLVLIQFFKAYNFRSDHLSILKNPFANRWLNLAVFLEIVFLVIVIYVPYCQKLLGTYNLPIIDWIIIVTLALTIIPLLEMIKMIVRGQQRKVLIPSAGV